MMRFLILNFFIYFRLTNAELLLLSKRVDDTYTLNCVAEGNDVNSTLIWVDEKDFPFYDFQIIPTEKKSIGNKFWKKNKSYKYDPNEPIIDERWEEFETIKVDKSINKNYKINYDNENINFLSFSLFTKGPVKLKYCNNNKCNKEKSITIDKENLNIDYMKWIHFKISIQNKQLSVNYYDSNLNLINSTVFENEIDVKQVILKSDQESFWKIHKYDYIYTNDKDIINRPISNFSINQKDGFVVLFVSLCNKCILGASLLKNDRKEISSIQIINEENDAKWNKIQLPFKNLTKNTSVTVSVYIDTIDGANVINPFWIIQEIRIRNENVRNVRINVTAPNLINNNIKCKTLEEKKSVSFSRNLGDFDCPYLKFGINCNISLPLIDNSSDQYRICDEKHVCTCSWGFWGTDCRQECGNNGRPNTWGINCKNNCGHCSEILNKCHFKTGNCINGCEKSYTGSTCNDQFPVLINIPKIEKLKFNKVALRFSGKFKGIQPNKYICQYRKINSSQWNNSTSGYYKENETFLCEINNLLSATNYEARAILITNDGNTYDMEDVPKIQFKTDCKDFSISDVNIEIFSNYINYTIKNQNLISSCPESEYIVTISNNNTNIKFDYKTNVLNPCTEYVLNFTRVNDFFKPKSILINITTKGSAPPKQINITILNITDSSALIKWNQSSTNCLISYFRIEYYLNKHNLCINESQIKYRKIRVNSTESEVVLDQLKPFANYHFTIYAGNKYGLGPVSNKYNFETKAKLNKLEEMELPTNIKVNFKKIFITQAKCENLFGNISYKLNFTCNNQWCNENNNGSLIQPNIFYNKNSEILKLNLPNNLIPYSDYLVKLTIHRDNLFLNKSIDYKFKSPAEKPTKVREFVAYSKNETMIWLRWKEPFPSYGELEKYRLIINNKIIENITKFQSCKIWTNYSCYVINELNANQSYKIQMQAKNKDVEEYGDRNEIKVETKEDISDAPTIINFTLSENNINISWYHPNITNGPLKYFQISFNVIETESNINYTNITETASISEEKQKYNYYKKNLPFTTIFNIYIKGYNKYEGKSSNEIQIITPPPKPNISSASIDSCSNVTCNITISFLKNNNLKNLNAYIIAINETSQETLKMRQNELNLDNNLLNYIKANNTTKDEKIWKIPLKNFNSLSYNGVKIENNENLKFELENTSNHTINIHNVNKSNLKLILVVENNYKNLISYRMFDLKFEEKLNDEKDPTIIYAMFGIFSVLVILIIVSMILWFIWKKNNYEFKCFRNRKILKNADETHDKYPLISLEKKKKLPSKRINLEQFPEYLQTSFTRDKCQELKKQHAMMPRGQLHPWESGMEQINKKKNRYANLNAYDHSRVVLKNYENGDYINANYVDGYKHKKAYIATQGPKKETINDFWYMIKQENVKYIVMLTNIIEKGKKKCEQYWPDDNCSKKFGDFSIKNVKTQIFVYYTIRELEVQFGNETFNVKQLHFTNWPDHGVPIYRRTLLPFIRIINEISESFYPIVVHCSAGVGRTGTIILCDIALKMAKNENKLDFPKIYAKMRHQRINLVDNHEQYIFAHLMIYEYLFGKDYSITIDDELDTKIEDIIKNDKSKELLNYLENVNWQDINLLDIYENLSITDENKMKNRDPQILPGLKRLFIPQYPPGNEGSDYINAVTVNCFNENDKFIVTQQPMPNTLNDFWRMIDHHKIELIISLNNIRLNDTTCCQIWPAKDNIMKPNDFITIKTVDEIIENNLFTFYELELENCATTNVQKRKVNIFSVNEWESKDLVPHSLTTLLRMLEEMFSFSGDRKNQIVVTCYDGATASGLFVALAFLIEKIKFEHVCDVALAIQTVRMSRPQFLQHKVQVEFLYKSALQFIKSFEIYANFNN